MTHLHRQYPRNDAQGIVLLNALLASRASVPAYRDAMYRLGLHLGAILLEKLDRTRRYGVITTAEDVDYLVKGLVEVIGPQVGGLAFACYWNLRMHFGEGVGSAAPIVKKFLEPGFAEVDDLIVVKAVISTACVVRTNITDIIKSVVPHCIHVVAPVIFRDADQSLIEEFPVSISEKFNFTYLAIDSERDANGNLVPGVGGEIYGLLGFGSQDEKNHYIPEIVRQKLAVLG